MKIGVVVQARMSSSRLPGKVLHSLAGKPLLAWLLDALAESREAACVVVATSTDQSDDPVAQFARERGIALHRGSLTDVRSRVVGAARAGLLDGVVRVSGDSPVLDPKLVDHAIRTFRADEPNLVTNVWPRTYPVGQSVEVFETRTLEDLARQPVAPGDLEHVTPVLYRQPASFRVLNLRHDPDLSHVRLVVDNRDDAAAMASLLDQAGDQPWKLGLGALAHLAGATR